MDAPQAAVWELIARFEHWPVWGPTVRAVDTDAEEVAPGVTGRVQTPLRLWLPFRIDEVDPGRSWNWSVAGVSATSHHVQSDRAGGCSVEFTAPVWAAPYKLVLGAGLRRLRDLAERT